MDVPGRRDGPALLWTNAGHFPMMVAVVNLSSKPARPIARRSRSRFRSEKQEIIAVEAICLLGLGV